MSLFLRLAIDYSDETTTALNHMFGDALLAADGHLGLSSRLDEPGRYVHLTDTILHQIRQSTNEVRPYVLIVRLWTLYTDVMMYRNLQLPGLCSIEWIRTTSTGVLGHGSSRLRSNSKNGAFLSLHIPFQPPPMIYQFRQECTMGQSDPTISSSVCTRYTATSKVVIQTNMSTRSIACRECKHPDFFICP